MDHLFCSWRSEYIYNVLTISSTRQGGHCPCDRLMQNYILKVHILLMSDLNILLFFNIRNLYGFFRFLYFKLPLIRMRRLSRSISILLILFSLLIPRHRISNMWFILLRQGMRYGTSSQIVIWGRQIFNIMIVYLGFFLKLLGAGSLILSKFNLPSFSVVDNSLGFVENEFMDVSA